MFFLLEAFYYGFSQSYRLNEMDALAIEDTEEELLNAFFTSLLPGPAFRKLSPWKSERKSR